MQRSQFLNRIPAIKSNSEFETLAVEIAHYQAQNNTFYGNYLKAVKIAWQDIQTVLNIPFLPIDFYKNQIIKTGEFQEQAIFTSSATTGSTYSRHYIRSLANYESCFIHSFNLFYGKPDKYVILGLLPSYLERSGSSLITMVKRLTELSHQPESGFFLYDHSKLAETLRVNESMGKKTLLIGVTFALLDFAAKFPMQLKNTIVMETGGMKGRGEELTREEVTILLTKAFGLKVIHSEYGMTELMSQAYSAGNGLFCCPPWMRVLSRDPSDPFSTTNSGSGALNIIDLANLDTCAFIATQDLGRVHADFSFEVTGRADRADIRGCNLLVY